MTRMIPVVDSTNGAVSLRSDDTRTLDIPKGFNRRTPVAWLDAGSRVRCVSIDGRALVYLAFTTPLSSRVAGEECLVANGAFRATVAHPASYRLSAVDAIHE
jgi:hypothetical protein